MLIIYIIYIYYIYIFIMYGTTLDSITKWLISRLHKWLHTSLVVAILNANNMWFENFCQTWTSKTHNLSYLEHWFVGRSRTDTHCIYDYRYPAKLLSYEDSSGDIVDETGFTSYTDTCKACETGYTLAGNGTCIGMLGRNKTYVSISFVTFEKSYQKQK